MAVVIGGSILRDGKLFPVTLCLQVGFYQGEVVALVDVVVVSLCLRLRIDELHSCDHHLRDESTVIRLRVSARLVDALRKFSGREPSTLSSNSPTAAVASPCHPKSLHQMTERLCLSQPFSSLIPRVADLRRSVLEGALPRLLPSLQPVVEHQPELRLLPCSPPPLRLLSRIPR